ncbi:MAG: hypothetical protein U5K29_04610 [Acidimicrobiales bacterium]|nr:hypothetical protein [Acidimicrobiales bacterium]
MPEPTTTGRSRLRRRLRLLGWLGAVVLGLAAARDWAIRHNDRRAVPRHQAG